MSKILKQGHPGQTRKCLQPTVYESVYSICILCPPIHSFFASEVPWRSNSCTMSTPRWWWIDYRCRLGSLGKSFTASSNSESMGMVGQSCSQAIWIFLYCYAKRHFLFSFFSACLLPQFLCLISILLFPCTSSQKNTNAWVPYFLQPY